MNDKDPSTESSPPDSVLSKEIPLSRPLLLSGLGLLGAFGIFLYGVIVGLYQAPPWETIRPLVVPDEATMQELLAEQAARQMPMPTPAQPPAPTGPPSTLNSTLLNFDIRWLNIEQPIVGLGGGLSSAGDRILITRQLDGGLWMFDESKRLFFQTGVFMPPSNLDVTELPSEPGKARVFPPRYNNVLVGEHDGGEFMVAFYSYNNEAGQCRTIRVARTDLPAGWDEPAPTPLMLSWTLLFESSPCLSFAPDDPPITGYQEGGFLTRDAAGDILFGTGDMGQEGSPVRPVILTQDEPATNYGRVFRVRADSWEVEALALGARNPQGATLDGDGNVWFVDQGPMGGDEVNLVEAGANYGWPWVTYGAHYTDIENDGRRWFHSDVLGTHEGYDAPKHLFVPSVAPSDISAIDDVHPNWDGDLLVSTLVDGALVRLIREGEAILGQETLNFRQRMRSVEVANGRIYFMTDKGVVGYLSPRPTDVNAGPDAGSLAVLEANGCIECHSKTSIPSLSRVFGQPIASQPGVAYSAALRGRSGRWTEANLRAYLANPAAFAPGTTMPAAALSEKALDEVVDALEALSEF